MDTATTSESIYSLDRVSVTTEHPVAYESADHQQPWGTARDNSRNWLFNAKLARLFADRYPLRVLDLGCSGGGFVRDCLDDGCLAVGIEGSDYSLRTARAEWSDLGNRYLFTADITRPFTVLGHRADGEQQLKFDVITAWEVLEHIEDRDLTQLCENIGNHLASGGLFIGSVSPLPEVINGVELHKTVEQEPWWIDRFAAEGLTNLAAYADFFNSQYVRGPKQGAPGSFHVFLSADPQNSPTMPRLTIRDRVLDRWVGSRGYHAARALIGVGR